MKKTSKLILIPMLLVAGVAHATTGGGNSGFNANMGYGGKIIGMKVATWSWEISDRVKLFADKQDVGKNDKVDSADGLSDVYQVGDKDIKLPLVQGYLNASSTSGTGIVPKVMISYGFIDVDVPLGASSSSVPARINHNYVPGMLVSFDLVATMAVIKKEAATNTVSWFYDSSLDGTNEPSLARKALSVITEYNSTVHEDFPNIPSQGSPADTVDMLGTYPSNFDDRVVAGWYSQISNVRLIVPKSYTGGRVLWHATIPLVMKQP